jgi:hypothetical protein
MRWLKQIFLFCQFWSLEISRIQGHSRSVSDKASLLGLYLAVLSVCPQAVFPSGVSSVSLDVLIASSYKDTSHVGSEPTLMTLF